MICPVCHIDMIVVEYERIELDHCTGCHGVWFDAGELSQVIAFLVEGGLEKPRAKQPRLLRPHPHCPTRDGNPVVLDRSPTRGTSPARASAKPSRPIRR